MKKDIFLTINPFDRVDGKAQANALNYGGSLDRLSVAIQGLKKSSLLLDKILSLPSDASIIELDDDIQLEISMVRDQIDKFLRDGGLK